MKDSGVLWLGQVPEHWEVTPLCAIARMKSITDKDNRELLSVYLQRGVVRFTEVDEKRTNVTSEDLSKYQAVDPGDFVLNNQQAWRGSVGVSRYVGIVSPAYLVLSLSPRIDPAYADLLFRGRSMVDQYLMCSRGVGTIQRNLYWPSLKRLFTLLPPVPDQAATVRFLDHAARRIRRYIRSKQKLIKLLEEQKQAIIHRAVTRGLDPNVRLKPSGVAWLGNVPEHWEVRKLKRLCRIQSGYAFQSSLFGENGVAVVRMNNLRRGTLDLSDTVRIPNEACIDSFALHDKDILYGLSGSVGATGSLGNFAVVRAEHLPAQLNQRIARLEALSSEILNGLLLLWLQASSFYEQVLVSTTGTAQFNVSTTDIEQVRVALPPLSEQTAIVRFVDEKTTRIDALIVATHREADLLREYRTRLIADVVTGKVDVREAAARLPEEIEEPEPLDESEVANDVEEAAGNLDAAPEEAEA
jgi:type I restriction enzyme S subunit